MSNPLEESPGCTDPLEQDADGQDSLRTVLDNRTYLAKYLPLPRRSPHLPEQILDSLKKTGCYDDKSQTWVKIPQQTKNGGGDIYEGLVEVFESIRVPAEKHRRIINRFPGRWVDTHDVALQTWSRSGISGLKPDISFVHNETDDAEVLWSRVYSVMEVKVKEEVEDKATLAAQLGSYVGHIFAEQIDRLFVNALTLCGRKLQISRCDRSGFVNLEIPIDIDKDPLEFVHVIASFSYLPPTDLGWDPTCMVWNGEKDLPQPSYRLPQNVFEHCGVYDLPWVLTVGKEDYVAIGPVNANRSLSIWGRATVVFHAVELEHWKRRNDQAKVYILKQCWQRLPGLISEPETAGIRNGGNTTLKRTDREEVAEDFGNIRRRPFEALTMERAGWKDRIKASWNVELSRTPITTFKTIRKNHATGLPLPSSRKNTSDTGTSVSTRTPSSLNTIDDAPHPPVLVMRTLVRLVFDQTGWPIERFSSKLELLSSLKMIVEDLETLHKNGVVHRDVSLSNLIISDTGAHIIDYDNSKVGFAQGGMGIEKTETEDVVEIATEILGDEQEAQTYVDWLKELWGITDRPATRKDFGWPEGTHEYISSDPQRAPFHHGGEDLDSLWWSINLLPLTLEGPGGTKRKDAPLKVIQEYYGHGPEKKGLLMHDLKFGEGAQLRAMMTTYSNYFHDLKDFMRKWLLFLSVALRVKSYEYYHPHRYLIKIIDEVIQKMNEKPDKGEADYEEADEEERNRREKERADMAEAIREQITVPILRRLKYPIVASVEGVFSSIPEPNVTDSGPSTIPTSLCPEHSAISLTTVDSPERDRAVKRARSGT